MTEASFITAFLDAAEKGKPICCILVLQTQIFCDEQESDHPEEPADSAFDPAVQESVGHDPQSKAVTDTVCEYNPGNHDVSGESTGDIIPVDLCHRADHEEPDDDQSGSGCKTGDGKEDGGANQREEEEECTDHGGKTGSGSGFHPDRRFSKCGCGTCSKHAAGEGCDGVGNEDFLDSGDGSIFFHKWRIDNCTADGADGIKEVGEEEGETDDNEIGGEQQFETVLLSGICPVVGIERGTEEIAETMEWFSKGCGIEIRQERIESGFRHNMIDPRELADDPQSPGSEDADEQCAHDFLVHQIGGDQDTCESQDSGDAGGMEFGAEEVLDCNQGSRMIFDDVRIFECNEGDEKSNPAAHGVFQRQRDAVNDSFPDGAERQEEKEEPFDYDCEQCKLPGIAHGFYYRIGKKGIQPHGRCEDERIIGNQCHTCSTEECGKCSGIEYRALIHAGTAENCGVDCKDVRNRKEGDYPGIDFCPDGCIVFPDLEKPFQKVHVRISCKF